MLSPRLLPLLLVPLAGCGEAAPDWPADRPGPKVVASFPPVYCFAVNVGGDAVSVRSAMTDSGPHHFDPTAADMRRVRGADLFVLNGLRLDTEAAQKLKAGSRNDRLVLVDLGATLPKNLLEDGECRHDHADGQPHEHGKDPHVWLGPDLAVLQVKAIGEAFAAADPPRADDYRGRATKYAGTLDKLLADGRALLQGKADRKIVTSHESLEYFARAFGLSVADVIATTPGREPTPKELADLVDSCVRNKVRVIAVEPQYATGGIARRIADELRRQGVSDPAVVEIDPLETARESDLSADWYDRKMRQNLQVLAGALK